MTSTAREVFNSLKTHADLKSLVEQGEVEGLYLECKSPPSPQLNADMKSKLAKAISGFANSAGGVVIWGISTTKHAHNGMDVLTQLEPIGNCRDFMRQVQKSVLTITNPRVQGIESRAIHEKLTDTRGLVVTYIPQSQGDPIQSALDSHFYFRSGDEFTLAPYELIKRLFAATESPDLSVRIHKEIVNVAPDGTWQVPIVLTNRSSAIAEHVNVSVTIMNPAACDLIQIPGFGDNSSVNPGKKIFIKRLDETIHRGMDHISGDLHVKMKTEKVAKRVLKILITLYANRMRARSVSVTISLAKKGLSILDLSEDFIY